MFPPALLAFFAERGWGAIRTAHPVGGGCINDGHILTTATGPQLFLKRNASAPTDMFAREAEGLTALAVPGGPRVPQPLLVDADFLLLEFLPSAPPAPNGWEVFGQRLAALHAVTHAQFGFPHSNYIGSTPQPNAWRADGFQFFAEQRLLFQGKLARERGALSASDLKRLEHIAAHLANWIPPQPASLLHGDLWSGNVLPGPDGHAALIDPAAHYGWAEADVAMTTLFGRLPAVFYSAYEAARPLPPGAPQRFELYNLYHLLNHLNLFGGSYLGAVRATLARYG